MQHGVIKLILSSRVVDTWCMILFLIVSFIFRCVWALYATCCGSCTWCAWGGPGAWLEVSRDPPHEDCSGLSYPSCLLWCENTEYLQYCVYLLILHSTQDMRNGLIKSLLLQYKYSLITISSLLTGMSAALGVYSAGISSSAMSREGSDCHMQDLCCPFFSLPHRTHDLPNWLHWSPGMGCQLFSMYISWS